MNSKSKHNYLKKIYEELRTMRAVLRMFVDAPTAGNLKVLVDHEKYFTKSTKKIEKFFSDNYAELPRKFTDDREDGSNFRGMCVHVINNTISDAKDVLMMSNKKG
jgi:hypothetical protein